MGSSRVLTAVPVMVLVCAFPAFSQDAGGPVVSRPNDSKARDSRLQESKPQDSKPVIVQPGAPGQPSRILPEGTRATAPPISPKDIEFMEGMILHHSQAVELTELIQDRTEDTDIRLLGGRIMSSQSDEIEFMKAWLKSVGQWGGSQWGGSQLGSGAVVSGAVGSGAVGSNQRSVSSGAVGQSGWRTSPSMSHGSGGYGTSGAQGALENQETSRNQGSPKSAGMSGHAGMPGMLSPQQMTALKRASGKEFDRLFLLGMIQHHEGALVMVKDLFETAGAGQNAELFGFATDVDSGQRAEIATMKRLLGSKFPKQ